MYTRTMARLLIFAATIAALPLGAQQRPGLGFGASLGANLPTGDFDAAAKPGIVATGFLELRLPATASVRGELFYSRSNIDNPLIRSNNGVTLPPVSPGQVSGDVNMVGASADLVLTASTPLLKPYVIGGVGVFRQNVSQNVTGTTEEFQALTKGQTQFGWNGGAGLKLSVLNAGIFVEGRLYQVYTKSAKTNFVPVTLGISF